MHLEGSAPDVRELRKETPPVLAEVLAKAMANGREDRWQSAAEMRAALE